MTPPATRVVPAQWADAVSDFVAQGFGYLDLMTAVDRPQSGEIEVVLHLVRLDDHATAFLVTAVDRTAPSLGSIVGLLPAAAWHEREMHEMFGLDFPGHPDLAPLLLPAATHPMRKDVALEARGDEPKRGRR